MGLEVESNSGASTVVGRKTEEDLVRSLEGTSSPGSVVGRYLVIEEVGRGGMGVVLRAYDPRLQREVALKLVRARGLTTGARTRMIREARAMAKLSDPHVVAVYDVVVDADDVVLVMEYVPGVTLLRWVTDGNRSGDEVLTAFVDAGRGLAAAHAQGLQHRDFKPSNVMLAQDGRVKVMDFGLALSDAKQDTGSSARAPDPISQDSGDPLTKAGTVMGTPRYMSPEQHRGEEVTDASDQYSFCVAVWEGLVGRLPFEGDLVRHKQQGPPRWPGAPGVSSSVGRALRRGLAADSALRWPSMDALLAALLRYPRTPWIAPLAITGALSIGALAWAGGPLFDEAKCTGGQEQLEPAWDDQRRSEIRDAMLHSEVGFASAVWEQTERDLDDYAKRWGAMFREACEATTILAEQPTEVMDLRMGCLNRVRIQLGATTQVLARADAGVLERAHEMVAALPPLAECADLEALRADVAPPPPGLADSVERVRETLAELGALEVAGRYDEARELLYRANADVQGLAYEPVLTQFYLRRAHLLDAMSEFEAASAAFEEAYRLGSKWGQWQEAGDAATRLAFISGTEYARHGRSAGYLRVAKGLTSHTGDAKGQAAVRSTTGLVRWKGGEYAEAEAELRGAIAQIEETLGPDHANLALARLNLGAVLYDLGRYADMEQECRLSLDALEDKLGPDHPTTVVVSSNLALALDVQGKHAEAQERFEAVLERQLEILGPDHSDVANTRNNLAVALKAQAKYAEAETQYREALRAWAKTLGEEHPYIAGVRHNLANILIEQEKREEAEALLRSALALRETALGADHPDVARTRSNLGLLLLEGGRPQDARAVLDPAWKAVEGKPIPPRARSEIAFGLARALHDTGEPHRAESLARVALDALADAEEDTADARRQIETWLRER